MLAKAFPLGLLLLLANAGVLRRQKFGKHCKFGEEQRYINTEICCSHAVSANLDLDTAGIPSCYYDDNDDEFEKCCAGKFFNTISGTVMQVRPA
jgi:hypothetical protein